MGATANRSNGKPVDIVFIGGGVSVGIGLNQALQRVSYPGLSATPTAYAPQLTSAVSGITADTQWTTPEAASTTPEMAEIVSALNAAGVQQIGRTELAGWFSADMFLQIAKAAGKNLTPEKWAKAAAKTTWEVEGVAGPTSYPNNFAVGTPCSQLAKSDGTKWTVTAPHSCESDVVDAKTLKLVPFSKVNPKKQY